MKGARFAMRYIQIGCFLLRVLLLKEQHSHMSQFWSIGRSIALGFVERVK